MEVPSQQIPMAKRGCLQQESFVMFNNPPLPNISSFVISGVNGVYYVRRYANTMPIWLCSFVNELPFNPKKKKNLVPKFLWRLWAIVMILQKQRVEYSWITSLILGGTLRPLIYIYIYIEEGKKLKVLLKLITLKYILQI